MYPCRVFLAFVKVAETFNDVGIHILEGYQAFFHIRDIKQDEICKRRLGIAPYGIGNLRCPPSLFNVNVRRIGRKSYIEPCLRVGVQFQRFVFDGCNDICCCAQSLVLFSTRLTRVTLFRNQLFRCELSEKTGIFLILFLEACHWGAGKLPFFPSIICLVLLRLRELDILTIVL